MTPAEAIRILTQERNDHHSYPTDIIGKAEQLGIEALAYYQRLKLAGSIDLSYLLPGETKE